MSVVIKTAENVRAEIARKAMKTAEVAALWEISPEAVRQKLKGDVRITVEELADLANRLDIPIARLLDGVDLPKEGE